MSLESLLDIFNGPKVQKGMVRNLAAIKVKAYLWPILDDLGQEKLELMIEKGYDLSHTIPSRLQQWLREQMGHYKWVLNVLDDNDLIQLLPPWFVNTCAQTEPGKGWLQRQLDWVRRVIGGSNEYQRDLRPVRRPNSEGGPASRSVSGKGGKRRSPRRPPEATDMPELQEDDAVPGE